MPFIKVALKNEIAVGEMKKYDVKENEITIVNLGGEFFALEDRCPHMNSPLHLGRLEGDEIVCPLHQARFNIRSGKKVSDPKIPIPKVIKMGSIMANVKTHDLKKYEIKIQNDEIYIDL